MNKFVLVYVFVILGTLICSLYFSYSSQRKPWDFTFTWDSGTQRIVDGTFRLEVDIEWSGSNLTVLIRANDDDYNEADYVGLVFDLNQNGAIDTWEESCGLFACNKTVPSRLREDGFLAFTWSGERLGPHRVVFTGQTGYTYTIQFPYEDEYGVLKWNPTTVLKRGDDNPLHICFFDADIPSNIENPQEIGHVFVKFEFFIPENQDK